MKNVHLSKSRYCRAKQCKKMFWMDMYKPEEKKIIEKERVFKNGNLVGELAKGLFGEYIDIEFDLDLSKMIVSTEQAMEHKPNVIAEASFNYNNNFCSVDVLKNDLDGVEIYEVKSSTHLKDVFIEDASYQYYVLTNLGYKVKKVCVVHLNKEYRRHGELEVNKLFKIEDITEFAHEKIEEISENVKSINEYMKKYGKEDEPVQDIGMCCS